MTVRLTPHPDTPCEALDRIEVEVSRPRPQGLALRFEGTGDISRLVLPAWVRRSRADELWRSTCFEAFIADGRGGYHEFNLSPSGQWAAYGFSGYRLGMEPHAGVELRDLARGGDGTTFTLAATLDLDRLGLPVDRPWRLGLSAVIEEASGAKSYWALAHAPGKPDFHHPDAFALDLPPLESA
jgi:hypothetical protein